MFFRPLDEQKGEDEQQHPTVRDRCGPGTSQCPPPWRPARTLTETAGSSSTTTLPWNPAGSPSRGPALRVGCCRARPGLESTDSPGVLSLAPRGHLQEWLMSWVLPPVASAGKGDLTRELVLHGFYYHLPPSSPSLLLSSPLPFLLPLMVSS